MNILHGYLPEMNDEMRPVLHVYSYNQNRRFKTIQKACLWVLRKLGCEHRERVIEYTSTSIDTTSVIAMVQAQYNAISRRAGPPPRYVIVGREQAHELTRQHLNRQMHLDLGCSGNKQLMGMTLIIAPWFDGVVCLSELE